ncbi:hypothetical protein NDU88_004909 [Pleurodeles waltl]|uniref:Uncharacterized protein n=1 Tax=Pleurodeles waltl TaxID=8319 RepID=A0AAV7MBA4_PLEWA|nr:hypothetical protein NDU88_004909 [Pleurodeles waltl]
MSGNRAGLPSESDAAMLSTEEAVLQGEEVISRREPAPLVLRVLPRSAPGPQAGRHATRTPVRPRAGEGLGQPARHTGRNRPAPPPVTPLVTSTRRLSAAAGLVTARLRASSSGPFSLLLVRPQQDLVGGP